MRELHVVALSEDGRHAVLATSADAGRGGFRLALDDRLAAALRGELTRGGQDEQRGADLSVKDIQARLRAGESADEIARSAGLPLARVERFAGPVLSERARMIDAAQAAHVVRGRRGRSLAPLGEAVEAALEQVSGLRPETVEWTTRRDEEGHWVVSVSWVARARRRSASWTWDPASKALTAVDAPSAALGHTAEPLVRRAEVTPRPAVDAAPPARRAPTPARKAGARAASPAQAKKPRATTAKADAPKAAPKPKVTKSASPRVAAKPKTAAKRAAAGAAPATRAPAPEKAASAKRAPAAAKRSAAVVKAAPVKRAAVKAAAVKRGPAAAPTTARRGGLRVVPDPGPTATPRTSPAAKRSTAPRTPARGTPPSTRRTVPAASVDAAGTPSAPRRTARGAAAVPDRAAATRADSNRDGVRTRASVPGWADVLLSTSPREDGPGGSH